MPTPRRIAIDGPAGAGKSTIGALLAERLGYRFIDTGAMYRAIALLALRRVVAPEDGGALEALARTVRISIGPPTVRDGRAYTVLVDGGDVTWDIRDGSVDRVVSQVARHPAVRDALVEQQRRLAERGRLVMVGRDIGTVVLPEAELKVFLTASAQERARRRGEELEARGVVRPREELLREILRRDQLDTERAVAPLRAAADAVVIETDGHTVGEALERVMQVVASRIAMSGAGTSTAPVAVGLPWWPLLFPIGRLLGLFLVPVRVEGRERVPRTGGYLLVANHISWLDPPWIEFVIGRPIRYMAKRELFEVFVLGWLLRAVGVFPVTRYSADRRALAHALDFLARGEIVGVFPEGHRSDDGTLIRGHAGAGYLARKSEALIVPTGISGSRGARCGRFWRRDVTIRFGEPFRATQLDGSDEQGLADAMMRRIAALLPPGQRGVYARGA